MLKVRSKHSGLEYEVVGTFGLHFLCRRLTSNGLFSLHIQDIEPIT